jgi:hypothetical protein
MVLMSSLGLTEELRLICQTNAQPNLRAVAGWCREALRPDVVVPSLDAAERDTRSRTRAAGAAPRAETALVEPDAAEAADFGERCRARAATPRSIA